MPHSFVEPLERRLLFARALGIDVYSGDGSINWTSVKNSGISFAWAKATEGVDFTDSRFVTNMANASAAGVYVGGYDFGRWDTHLFNAGASDEENYFWSVIQPYITGAASNGHYLMPVLDLERGPGGLEPTTKGYNKTTFSAWANTWCQDLVNDAAAIGVSITPVIYTGVTFANAYLDSTVSAKWPLWMSNYAIGQPSTGDPSGTTPWTQWNLFQYSATGTVPGISGSGNVDLDVLQGDTEVLKDYLIGNAGRFADGTWVRVNTGALNAWNNSTSDSNLGDTAIAIPSGTIGKILQGPVYAKSFWRWQVQYNNGVTGWSAEYQDGVDGTDWLVTATPTAATNLNVTGAVNSLPANFTWTAGTNVASYDVYLDNVKQATVTTNSWAHGAIATGAHTWHVIASNGTLSADSALASFTYDTTAPTASFGGQTPTAGMATFDFTITYTDALSGLLASSFDAGDISVSGPGGNLSVSFVSTNTAGDGSPRTVTYRVSAPGGVWDASANGTWTITQVANQVRDVAGNFRSAGTIGSFTFNTPFAYIVNGTLLINYANTNSVTLSNDASGNIVATEVATSLTFAPAAFTNIVVQGSSANEGVFITAALTKPITFNGQTGADTITIGSGGSVGFSADAAAMSASLDFVILSDGSATFSANQHFHNLIVSGTASLIGGPGRVIVARSISVAGSIDLHDNNLVIDYPDGGESPLGSWNGTAYTGVSGLVASGKIITSLEDSLHTLGVAESTDGGSFFDETLDTSAVIVKFTYAGDATLDGKLNIDDYTRIDVGIAAGIDGWSNGDFNRDGKINIDDYVILDGNLTGQGPPI